MNRLRWWMRIVGAFYVLQFVMVALVRAPIKAQAPPDTLARAAAGDPLARFLIDTWVTFGLEMLAIGVGLLVASRWLAEARPLVWTVIGIELSRGIAADIYMLLRGLDPGGPAGLDGDPLGGHRQRDLVPEKSTDPRNFPDGRPKTRRKSLSPQHWRAHEQRRFRGFECSGLGRSDPGGRGVLRPGRGRRCRRGARCRRAQCRQRERGRGPDAQRPSARPRRLLGQRSEPAGQHHARGQRRIQPGGRQRWW